MPTNPRSECPGCGVLLPPATGPVHPYMESSAACWAAFGEVLARGYATPSLDAVHRLAVDTYAAQHPGGTSRQAIQSVGLHLVRLCLFLERGLAAERANAAMLRADRSKAAMVHLARPASLGVVTVADVREAWRTGSGDAAHREAVRAWAESVWDAWHEHHATVRRWADAAAPR